MGTEGWRGLASCLGKPVEWWFPTIGTRGARALATCAECPVLVECAVELRQVEEQTGIIARGIWAGTTEDDRRKVRRRSAQRDVPRSCPVCDKQITVAATGIMPTYCSNSCGQRASYRRSAGAPIADAEFVSRKQRIS